MKFWEEIQAVEKERKAKNILLMAIPKEHMRRFHGMDDAKEIWEAIRTRVFEQEIQGASKTSSSAQNVAFVSQSKSSTNKVKSGFTGAYSTCTPSTSSTNIPKKEVLAGFVDEVIYSLFAKQSKDWDLLHEDLEQIDDVDIEEMDINWQIAMIAIRMKKFYKKTGRRVRVDGKTPVGFDKKKLECFNCHNTGHFARECTAKGTHDGKKKRDSFYQHQEAGKQEKNQMGLLTMDDGIVNWGEHTEVEETNHALMAISSSNEVTLCSKTCIDSYNTLKLLCDEQMNQLGDQEAQILAYSQAVKKLEAQLVTFQKQQLSLNEKLTFQANEIYEKDEKLKRYRRIGMKVVKEKEQLQKTLDSWKDSSKNLWRLIDSGMSSNSKVGLGFEIQSNNEVLSYEEEMNFSVFNCSKEDSIGKPLYSRFTKTNDFKGVPHPLSGDYTPSPQDEIDESLYVYGKKGPQEPEPSVSDDRSSEFSTCQSNDSAGSIGTSSEHSVDLESEISRVPSEVYVSTPITTNKTSVSAPKSKEVEPSCVSNIKTPRQPIKEQATPKVNRKNWNAMMERELGEGYSFTKKKCFVCGSLSHLIKDCDYYEKKKAREAEVKRVVNTGNGMAKPVWTNANRVNHSNKFVPRSVQLNAGRPNINSVRPNINTGRTNINSVRPRVNVVGSNVNTVRSRQPEIRDLLLRPQQVIIGGTLDQTPIVIEHLLKNMVDRGIFDSGCSGHMTGNKDQLEDFEEFNGGSVTFGGSKGYISGKGKIRVGNLDFDSVSFVKELGHFNLFSISQICDKQHKVLFTETECLVVSSDFKMPNENQILLKVPRHHNMYSFDMKTPSPTKGFAYLIAKATSDESKLWHRRLGPTDASGITMLPNEEIFEGMGQMRYPTDGTFTFWKSFFTPQWRYLVHQLLHCISSKSGGWDQFGSNIATALISHHAVTQSQPSSSTLPVPPTSSPPVQSPPPILASILTPTPIPATEPTPFEHTFEEPSPVHQHFSPPQEQAHEQMTMDDLLQVVPQLISRIDSIGKQSQQTKLTMGNAIVKKNLAQGRKSQDDPLASLVQGLVTPSMTKVNASWEEQVEDISPNTLEATKTLSRVASLKPKSIDKGRRYKRRKETKGKKVVTSLDFQEEVDTAKMSIPSPDKGQRAGKAPMIIEETPKKSKEQVLQEEASLAEAIRLDTLQKEDEDWDLIRAKIKANAELSKSMLGSDLQGEDFAKKMNQGTWKLSQLKNLSFEEVKEEFDKLVKQVESFAPINFEATKASLKRFGEELQTKTTKRLKDDEAKDAEPAKKSGKRRKQMARKGLHTDLDKDDSEGSDEVSEQDDSVSGTKILINPVPVAMKSPSIATYKIIKQGEKGVYQIVREDGTDIVYINFGAMLKDISRDDLTELYRIVMNRYGMDGPEDELEKVFWKYLKNMFEEPLSTDPIWSLLEKSLSAEICKTMLNKKLQGGKPDKDCYKMLKMMEKQAGIRK
ncbi:putative ribonuclease H-like domain-containing protein [Tanacetum coccineum]